MKTPTKLRVAEVMSSHVVTVNQAETLHDALLLMEENSLGALPVVDRHGHCLGMLTATDLVSLTRELEEDLEDLDRLSEPSRKWLMQVIARERGEVQVRSVMSTLPHTVAPDASLVDAAREMLAHEVHRLPVVDGEKTVVGIVTTTDLLRALVAEGVE